MPTITAPVAFERLTAVGVDPHLLRGIAECDDWKQLRRLVRGYLPADTYLTEDEDMPALGGDGANTRTADRIDGYDRDDLGESPDY